MGGEIRAGAAFVEGVFKDKALIAGLNKTQRTIVSFSASATKAFMGVAAGAAAILAPMALCIKVGSEMEETMNKFNVVFGSNAKVVKAWADDFAGSMGRSKQQIAEFMASTQDLLVPLGFTQEEATKTSKTITQLAIDLASFNNMSDADTLRDLHAALTGSGEVMKKYGVVVSEAAVKQELLNSKLDSTKATEQEKAFARLSIILRGTSAAQGDAERSADSFANQTKRLEGEIKNAAASIGSALLPVVTPLVKQAGDVVQRFAAWVEKNQETVVMVAKVVAIVGGLAAIMGTLTTAIGGVTVALTFMLAHPVVLTVAAITTAVVGLTVAAHALSGGLSDLNKEMADLVEQGDRQRDADRARITELKQLAEKQSLSTDEMERANTLIQELRNQYGDFGASVNTATKRVEGMTDAVQDLNKAMREQMAGQLQKSLDERGENIKRLRGEMTASHTGWRGAVLPGKAEGRVAELDKQLMGEMEAARELRRRLESLAGGGDGAPAAAAAPAPAGAAATPAATKAMARPGGINPGLGAMQATLPGQAENAVSGETAMAVQGAQKAAMQQQLDATQRAEIEARMEGVEKQKTLLNLEMEQRRRELAQRGALTKEMESLLAAEQGAREQAIEMEESRRQAEAAAAEAASKDNLIGAASMTGTFSGDIAAQQLNGDAELAMLKNPMRASEAKVAKAMADGNPPKGGANGGGDSFEEKLLAHAAKTATNTDRLVEKANEGGGMLFI